MPYYTKYTAARDNINRQVSHVGHSVRIFAVKRYKPIHLSNTKAGGLLEGSFGEAGSGENPGAFFQSFYISHVPQRSNYSYKRKLNVKNRNKMKSLYFVT